MKKILFTCCLAASIALASCGAGDSREETDDKDSIDAARSADSLLQNELNADTSMNTDSTTDNLPTDSMDETGNKR